MSFWLSGYVKINLKKSKRVVFNWSIFVLQAKTVMCPVRRAPVAFSVRKVAPASKKEQNSVHLKAVTVYASLAFTGRIVSIIATEY